MWYFQHRNGEVAYEDEPLEFWEDWEGSEAGDKAEAMPNGWQLRHEVNKYPGPKLPMIERSDGRLTKYRHKKSPSAQEPLWTDATTSCSYTS
ncbi:Short-chain dehydrogenase/reductase sat3 [Hypoxylon texense]